jgi:hypothetical protein
MRLARRCRGRRRRSWRRPRWLLIVELNIIRRYPIERVEDRLAVLAGDCGGADLELIEMNVGNLVKEGMLRRACVVFFTS